MSAWPYRLRWLRGRLAYMGAYGAVHGDVITGDVIKCSDAEMGLALGFEMASQIRQGYWDATNRVKVHTGEGGQMYSTTNLKPS